MHVKCMIIISLVGTWMVGPILYLVTVMESSEDTRGEANGGGGRGLSISERTENTTIKGTKRNIKMFDTFIGINYITN